MAKINELPLKPTTKVNREYPNEINLLKIDL
jgi:hypothetical protein